MMTKSSVIATITAAQSIPSLLHWYSMRHGVVVGGSQHGRKNLNASLETMTLLKHKLTEKIPGVVKELLTARGLFF